MSRAPLDTCTCIRSSSPLGRQGCQGPAYGPSLGSKGRVRLTQRARRRGGDEGGEGVRRLGYGNRLEPAILAVPAAKQSLRRWPALTARGRMVFGYVINGLLAGYGCACVRVCVCVGTSYIDVARMWMSTHTHSLSPSAVLQLWLLVRGEECTFSMPNRKGKQTTNNAKK